MRSILFRPVIYFCAIVGVLSVFAVRPGSADTISTDTTWTLSGSPYIVSSNISVKGTDGADGITTLTIQPGVIVKFNQYRCMDIGAPLGDPGALIAQGTSADPVVFTSNQASPALGDWYYIRFYNTADDATTLMEHCIVEYGGFRLVIECDTLKRLIGELVNEKNIAAYGILDSCGDRQ